jgi:hypothetical protein
MVRGDSPRSRPDSGLLQNAFTEAPPQGNRFQRGTNHRQIASNRSLVVTIQDFDHGFGLSNRFEATFEGLSRRLDSPMGTDEYEASEAI